MDFADYVIDHLEELVPGTYLLRLMPQSGDIFSFKPGQFCQIKNPLYIRPTEVHMFSIASSPSERKYLEFCIKVYGDWTTALSLLQKGAVLQVAGPLGHFVWDQAQTQVVFLAGGVGIAPFMSMLRVQKELKYEGTTRLLYGSRTLDSIAYESEIDTIMSSLKDGKVIHILSHLDETDLWRGYRGFITEEILHKEVDLTRHPTFYLCGPPIFVQLMREVLKKLEVAPEYIRFELFARPMNT